MSDVRFYCPRCGETTLAKFLSGRTIMPTPHEPTLECRACGVKVRLGYTNTNTNYYGCVRCCR